MSSRIGPGPVFAYESVAAARRWQGYAARAGSVLLLLLGLWFVWSLTGPGSGGRGLSARDLALLGESFFDCLCGVQLALVLLAAPAATAGAICLDRARGSLVHMMVTDLTDGEIVLGKLAARLMPVFGLLGASLPVAALAGLLGGIDFGALAGSFAICLGLAALGCSLAMAASLRCRKTHEVLMAVYTFEMAWLLAAPIWWELATDLNGSMPPDWFWKANPVYLAYAPYQDPGTAGAADVAWFVGACLVGSALLVGLAVAGLRRAALGGDRLGPRRPGRVDWRRVFPSLPGPTLDADPVLWREWHRDRPSRLACWLWRGALGLAWAVAGLGAWQVVERGAEHGADVLAVAMGIEVSFGLLILAATSPTALGEERIRGSLDILMSTPLATRAIVAAKWRGAYRKAFALAILPAVGSGLVALAAVGPPPLASVARAPGYTPAIVAYPIGSMPTPLPPGAMVVRATPPSLGVPPGSTAIGYLPGTVPSPLPKGAVAIDPVAVTKAMGPARALAGPRYRAILTIGDRLAGWACATLDVLASAAAVVGFGLVAAIWTRRPGRAIGASVVFYLTMAIAWPIGLEIIDSAFYSRAVWTPTGYVATETPAWLESLAAISPIGGVIMPVEALIDPSTRPRIWGWLGLAAVIAIKAGFAWIAFEVAARTFDRSLGRSSERQPRPARLARAGRARERRRERAVGRPGLRPAAS